MTPPTIPEAIAIYESVPSIVTTDGDATVKQRAMACEIVRQPDDSWRVQFPQSKTVTLASGKVVPEGIAPISTTSGALIGQTVEIDGQQWPVALAFAIINAVYVREATTLPPPPAE